MTSPCRCAEPCRACGSTSNSKPPVARERQRFETVGLCQRCVDKTDATMILNVLLDVPMTDQQMISVLLRVQEDVLGHLQNIAEAKEHHQIADLVHAGLPWQRDAQAMFNTIVDTQMSPQQATALLVRADRTVQLEVMRLADLAAHQAIVLTVLNMLHVAEQ